MKLEKFYFYGSCLIASIWVIDDTLLLMSDGKLQVFNYGCSLIELMWVVPTLVAFILFILRKVPIISPLSYLIYLGVSFWLTVLELVWLASRHQKTSSEPIWMIEIGLTFAIYYLAVNVIMIKKKWAENPGPIGGIQETDQPTLTTDKIIY